MLATLDNKELTTWRLSGERYGLESVEIGDRAAASLAIENNYPTTLKLLELKRRLNGPAGGKV